MTEILKLVTLIMSFAQKTLRWSKTENIEEEKEETHYKSQPFSVDPWLIAYAIEEQEKQKKEEQERVATVPKSVAY